MAYWLCSRTIREKIVEDRLDLRQREDSGSDHELNEESESPDSMHLVKPFWIQRLAKSSLQQNVILIEKTHVGSHMESLIGSYVGRHKGIHIGSHGNFRLGTHVDSRIGINRGTYVGTWQWITWLHRFPHDVMNRILHGFLHGILHGFYMDSHMVSYMACCLGFPVGSHMVSCTVSYVGFYMASYMVFTWVPVRHVAWHVG